MLCKAPATKFSTYLQTVYHEKGGSTMLEIKISFDEETLQAIQRFTEVGGYLKDRHQAAQEEKPAKTEKPKAEKPAPTPEPKEEPEVDMTYPPEIEEAEDAPVIDLVTLRAQMSKLTAKGMQGQAKNLLTKRGYTKLSEVPQAEYAGMIEEIEGLLA